MHRTIPTLGHHILDSEHETVLNLGSFCTLTCGHINSRHDCSACDISLKEECRIELHKILKHALPLIENHFETEEGVMKNLGLDTKDPKHLAVHIASHQQLLADVKSLAEELINSECQEVVKLIKKLHNFIVDRVLDHLYEMDTKLIPYINVRAE